MIVLRAQLLGPSTIETIKPSDERKVMNVSLEKLHHPKTREFTNQEQSHNIS